MAITKIHPIKTTPHLALNYILSDKVEEIKSEEEINQDIPHDFWEDKDTGKKYVAYFTIASYKDCSPKNPYKAFEERIKKFSKESTAQKNKDGKEPLMYHLRQSFEGFEVEYTTANEIGRRLAEELFKDYVVVVTTHGNTNNIHNHFMISAWDSNGKKLHDCLALKREIRKVSDRLCEEYGLSVLENTREMKLVPYKDKNGVVHYYEPTDRKNEQITKRKNGEISTDDVNSYRNTKAYSDKEKEKMSNREEIRNDIDILLPSCRSYDELLLRLHELGYTIRAKKQNGDWLKHISFKAPTHDKATREDKLDEDGFYIRVNLTQYIEELNKKRELENQNKQRKRNEEAQEEEIPNVPYFENYEYGETDIDEVNSDYKTIVDENGELITVPRTEYEQKVVKDIKRDYQEIRPQHPTHASQKKQTQLTDERKRELIQRIQNSFRCLRYTEQHGIYSYRQILDLYKANKTRYDMTLDKFTQIEQTLSQLRDIQKIPEKLSALQAKVKENENNIAYIMEDYPEDRKEINNYLALLKKYKIDTPESQKVFFDKMSEFEKRQQTNRGYLANAILQMSELENCLNTYSRIDTNAGINTEIIVQEFNSIRDNRSDDSEDGSENVQRQSSQTQGRSAGKKQERGH